MHPQAPTSGDSPDFGYLSPPIDICDGSSEDGDTLRTPLTEHDNQQLNVFHQHDFQSSSFHEDAYPPTNSTGPFGHSNNPVVKQEKPPFPAISALVMPPNENLQQGHNHPNSFFVFSSPPSNALDLANASLEFTPFAPPLSEFNGSLIGSDSSTEMPDLLSSYTAQQVDPESSSMSLMELPLPSLSISLENLDDDQANNLGSDPDSMLLAPLGPQLTQRGAAGSENALMLKGRMYSPRFPSGHSLNLFFVRTYHLGDELGAGGYGFVMTAWHRTGLYEVAVKFIVKDKVPEHAWWEDDMLGRIPTEVMVMSIVNHDNIVKCLDLYEDDVYFYLVQELHGTPWVSRKVKTSKQTSAPGKLLAQSLPAVLSTPDLTPSPSTESNVGSLPPTPHQDDVEYTDGAPLESHACFSQALNSDLAISDSIPLDASVSDNNGQVDSEKYLLPSSDIGIRPKFSRRASYDLFECIEQSKYKRLSENQARYIFAQVVEAVHYLNSQGITHCDIKDENLVIDSELKVKLIDFGSAVVSDPCLPPPYYTLFFGTTAYAASEILLKKPYRSAPAEIWTLGVLLSYLLTGHSPFPTERDAMEGRIVIRERTGSGKISRGALSLMSRCLDKDPDRRADVEEVRGHRWLQGALERGQDPSFLGVQT